MTKISEQDYDYKEMKDALNSVKDVVNEKLNEIGEKVPTDFMDSIKGWFVGIGDWFNGLFDSNDKDLGILETTNDDLLGDDVVVDATDKDAIKLPTAEEAQGFFNKIWNWFTGLFNNESDTNEPVNSENSTEQVDSPVIDDSENIDSTIPADDNSSPEDTTNSTENTISSEDVDSSQDENNLMNDENINN